MSLFKNLFKEIWSNFRGWWLRDDVSRNLTLQHHVKPQENLSGNTNVHSSTTSSNVGFSPNLQQILPLAPQEHHLQEVET